MEKDVFLLIDKIKQIESSFIKDGWITIYDGQDFNRDNQNLVFCCLVSSKEIKNYKTNSDWVIQLGSEGKPTLFESYRNGKTVLNYQILSDDGIEPFIFYRTFGFSSGNEKYIDLSEEFVLYFNLYEKGSEKQNRKFYFIDELGDFDEVVSIEPEKIKVKLKYLKNYISIRKIYFSICFDFIRIDSNNLFDLNVQPKDENLKSDYYYYNHLIRPLDFEIGRNQSWIHGKVIINPDKKFNYRFDNDLQYATFITGYDENGNEKVQSCERTNDNFFILTYFKKDVLNKYYNEPNKYEVDGFHVKSNFFTLKIDNNVTDCVPVFLTELGSLPYKEQLHWKQYNIPPKGVISNTYYKTMIEGNWAQNPETPDLYFKYKYKNFNKKWKNKFNWYFYKPLAKEDEHLFTALHTPISNNVKAFCEQVLTIVKITIDRLNESGFSKIIVLDPKDRGITKLEKFLKHYDIEIPEMITFLRKLWDLRSGLLSHSFSSSNKDCRRAIEYFGLKEDNYTEVAIDIFTKSIFTINTLEQRFLVKDNDSENHVPTAEDI